MEKTDGEWCGNGAGREHNGDESMEMMDDECGNDGAGKEHSSIVVA